jgi:glucose/mannose-6-phosphate isomerase
MLDSESALRSHDKKDMLRTIEEMPKHLSEGRRTGRSAGLPKFAPKEIVVCGLGGSAIGGDLLQAWLSASCGVRCEICRSYSVPSYVGRDTLAIVASYSGNTEETLSMLEDARKKRAQIVTICSGGKLAARAESFSVPRAHVPTGLVPRASLGYMFGAMAGIVERSGIAQYGKQFEETSRVLVNVAKFCRPSTSTGDNPAKKLAHELFPLVPVVVGHGLASPVARRWANQLNECSKSIAFWAELPEMDHNLIIPLVRDPRGRLFCLVSLEHGPSSKAMRARVDATKTMAGEHMSVYTVSAQGQSPLAKMFSLIMMGDFASAYLGILHKEDPSSSEPIEQLKSVLAKK